MLIPTPLPEPITLDRFTGDHTGLVLPAHEVALRQDSAEFLTQAFHAFGALSPNNAVESIISLTRCPGGSTGAKFFLEIAYSLPDPALHTALFVKFSRDFADRCRDHPGRYEMASEAAFMALTRRPGFPTRVAVPYFADYERATGTGIIITEQVRYGTGEIEPHREKCLDFITMDDPLPYYRATITALARLCGAHKAGRLSPDIEATFPFDPLTGSADLIRYDETAFDAELATCRDFVSRCPQYFPEAVRCAEFLARMSQEAHMVHANEAAIRAWLIDDPDMIALCHWNAHVDNAFFWRENGVLQCGFIDWGRVGQITLGAALWGGLSAAHHAIWDHHLDELLALFAAEYASSGGPTVSVEALEKHLMVHIATMGVARVLAFPEIAAFRCPAIGYLDGPHDPALLAIEPARNTLHVFTVFLKLWHKRDLGGRIHDVLHRPAPSLVRVRDPISGGGRGSQDEQQ